nr:response regulator [Kribbella capetownensis]
MRVLVVEDEVYLAEAIRAGLRLEAIAADLAFDGNAALDAVAVNAYDVVVLDRDIPGPSGDEVCRQIVADGIGCRVLMLTAAGDLDDKVAGFELGADDYLTKPFELRELVVRLRALVRSPAATTPTVDRLWRATRSCCTSWSRTWCRTRSGTTSLPVVRRRSRSVPGRSSYETPDRYSTRTRSARSPNRSPRTGTAPATDSGSHWSRGLSRPITAGSTW